MRILPPSKVESRAFLEDLGFSFLRFEDGWGYLTGAFYARVENMAARADVPASLVLGLVAAHEIGHLLLRDPGHSRRGIMLPYWGPEDLRRAAQGTLTFTREESERIRAEVRARCQQEEMARSTDLAQIDKPRP